MIPDVIIDFVGSVISSNDYFDDYIKNSHQNNHSNIIRAVVTDEQTKGKGTQGKYWYSPPGQNIYFSLCCPVSSDIQALSGLTQIISAVIIDELENYYTLNHAIYLKFPNDIFYNNQKLGGCLIEIKKNHAIIGVGLNVNMMDDENHIDQPWISLKKILHKDINRNNLAQRLIKACVDALVNKNIFYNTREKFPA